MNCQLPITLLLKTLNKNSSLEEFIILNHLAFSVLCFISGLTCTPSLRIGDLYASPDQLPFFSLVWTTTWMNQGQSYMSVF